jgi:hypothetical protein
MVPVALIVAATTWLARPTLAGAGPPDGSVAAIGGSTESRMAPSAGKAPLFESVWVRVLRNVNTECKLCPSPGCLNKDWFGSSYQFQAVCWAQGAKVGNTA